jgi:hypothetical protein
VKTYVYLWYYLAEFFLHWEMSQTKVGEKIKAHILCSVTLFWKSCHLWDNVKKYGRGRQAIDDDMIQCMCLACWVTKARIQTCSKYVIFIAFAEQQWLREDCLSCYFRSPTQSGWSSCYHRRCSRDRSAGGEEIVTVWHACRDRYVIFLIVLMCQIAHMCLLFPFPRSIIALLQQAIKEQT